jgi:N-acetylglucosaminyl-diphospho-decaprenol L-rhamnosyltransferase
MAPLLTTIIVSYNTRHLLDECLATLRTAEARLSGATRTVVVDNASRDGSAEHLAARHPEVTLIRLPHNVGFGRANNAALPEVSSPYVLLLNTDAFMAPGALRAAIDHMAANPRCGVVGAHLLNRDGSSQPSARNFPTPWNVFVLYAGVGRWFPRTPGIDPAGWDPTRAGACDWVPGCFFLIRKSVIDQVGLFDPLFFLYAEEVDLCLRVKQAGWEVHYEPGARVVHLGGESAKSDGALSTRLQIDALAIESSLLYFRKHHGRLGLASHVLLEGLAGVVNTLKALLGRVEAPAPGSRRARARAMLGLLVRTQWGSKPTR